MQWVKEFYVILASTNHRPNPVSDFDVVWPIFFLMNVFIALKGTPFFIFIWRQNWMYSAVPEGYNSIGMYLHDVQPSCSYLSRLMTKQTKWHVRPAKTQISLGIRPVWSEYSLSARRKLDLISYALSAKRRLWSNWAVAQADLSLRWAHSHFVGFVVRWLILGYVVTENFRMSERAHEVYKSQITVLHVELLYFQTVSHLTNRAIVFIFQTNIIISQNQTFYAYQK